MRAASETQDRAALRKNETRRMKIQQAVSAILLLQQGIEEAIKNFSGLAVLEKKVFELALGVSRMMLEWVLRDLDRDGIKGLR